MGGNGDDQQLQGRRPPGLCPFANRGLTGSWNGCLTTAAAGPPVTVGHISWYLWKQTNIVSKACTSLPSSPPSWNSCFLHVYGHALWQCLSNTLLRKFWHKVPVPLTCYSGLLVVPSAVWFRMGQTITPAQSRECDAQHWPLKTWKQNLML